MPHRVHRTFPGFFGMAWIASLLLGGAYLSFKFTSGSNDPVFFNILLYWIPCLLLFRIFLRISRTGSIGVVGFSGLIVLVMGSLFLVLELIFDGGHGGYYYFFSLVTLWIGVVPAIMVDTKYNG